MADVSFRIDGAPTTAPEGTTIAAAVMNRGQLALRQSVTSEPRGALCGMGVCFECRVTVDGQPHVRACVTAVRDGMDVTTGPMPEQILNRPPPEAPTATHEHQVDIIGAGPAGLAAAVAAAPRARTVVIDENPLSGGQIWRAEKTSPVPKAARLRRQAENRGALFLHGAVVAAAAGEVLVRGEDRCWRVRGERVVMATGARETWRPFPGWTLPGVLGAGGLQALVKGGLDISGRRVLVSGQGPLLLAVAAYLRSRGALITALATAWTRSAERRLLPALLSRPGKAVQAATLVRRLLGVPRWYGARLTEVTRTDDGLTASLDVPEGNRETTVDLIACGDHLVPQTEVASLLGCRLENGAVAVDDLQKTSVEGVYCAGEGTGVGGVDLALAEGQVAGLAAAGDLDGARARVPLRAREARFAEALTRAFVVHEPLNDLPDPVVICRCEDVSWGQLRPLLPGADARQAKLLTRCGMGPCQGRICGSVNAAMLGWPAGTVRPPVQPITVDELVRLAAPEDRDD